MRRKDEGVEVEQDGTFQVDTEDPTVQLRRAHPLEQLEHTETDIRRANEIKPALLRLQDLTDRNHKDDYATNAAARKIMRGRRNEVKAMLLAGKAIGLNVELLPPSPLDSLQASKIQFKAKPKDIDIRHKKRKITIATESIFGVDAARESKLRAISKAIDKNINVQSIKMTVEENRNELDMKAPLSVKVKNSCDKEVTISSVSLVPDYASD